MLQYVHFYHIASVFYTHSSIFFYFFFWGGGAVAQSVERATPGEEVPGLISAVAAPPYLLDRCQYHVTG